MFYVRAWLQTSKIVASWLAQRGGLTHASQGVRTQGSVERHGGHGSTAPRSCRAFASADSSNSIASI
jgi:hypothetical protein